MDGDLTGTLNLEVPKRVTTFPARPTWRDGALAGRLVSVSLLCDAVVILFAMVVAFWLRFDTPIREIGVMSPHRIRDYAGYVVVGTLSLLFAMAQFQVYDPHKLLRLREVAMKVVTACVFWFAGFLSFSLAFKFQPPISRVFVFISAITVLLGLVAWRWIFHRYLQRSSIAGDLRQRILFVGWNAEAERLSRSFAHEMVRPYDVIGCVTSASSRFRKEPDVPVLGQYGALAEVIRRNSIDIVLLSDTDSVKGEIVGLIKLCEMEMVQFKVIPSYFQILVSGLHIETVAGIPVLGVSKLPLDRGMSGAFKRLMDVIGAVVGLLISAPLVAVFGALVWVEDPGPIFYRQRRMGRNGLSFEIIKIRSMKLDAEKETGARWAVKDDPRRLRIGAFMRKWNIDEVPQFWNVLKGEMSLVGPRPERPELIANFKEEIPHYNARLNAKPGITGWAQIKGLRGDTDLSERIRADIYYLENWSPLLDLQIMLMTFLRRDNAY